jgi:membrane protein DedA with SNARE-associated domain
MHGGLPLLALYFEKHLILAFLFVFVSVVIEGEIILLLLGVLLHLHVVPLSILILFLIPALVTKTTFWYLLGKNIKTRFPESKFLHFIETTIERLFPTFVEKPFFPIFISKFAYGLNHATLAFAGYKRVPIRLYALVETISSVVWVVLLVGTGYVLSFAALTITTDLRKVSIIILLGIVGFLIFQRVVSFLFTLFETYIIGKKKE